MDKIELERQIDALYRRLRVRLLAIIHDEYPEVPLHAREDIVQTAFLRLWRRCESLRNPYEGAKVNFLYATVRNLCKDYFRDEESRNRTRDKWTRNTGANYLQLVRGAVVEAAEEDKSLAQLVETFWLQSLMNELAPAQREAVRLRIVLGLTHSDLVQQYGQARANTLKANMRRARENLRRLYDHTLREIYGDTE
jgi:RNA polymerase sigma factor (sigma-70 family)